jgi:hypothetical protein
MVTGLFPDKDSAERAIAAVTSRGYAPSDVNVVIDDDVRQRYLAAHAAKDSALARATTDGLDLGGPAGATLGTLFTAITQWAHSSSSWARHRRTSGPALTAAPPQSPAA